MLLLRVKKGQVANTVLQLMDIDTVAIDLLSLLVIWLRHSESSKLPYSVLRSLSRILNPLHLTRSQRTIDVFLTSFSRLSPPNVCCSTPIHNLLLHTDENSLLNTSVMFLTTFNVFAAQVATF